MTRPRTTLSAPVPLMAGAAVLAATLTTALPGFTWALAGITTVEGDVGPQIAALAAEAVQAVVMAAFGAVMAWAHVRRGGRWLGVLIAPLDLAVVLVAGVWMLGRIPVGQGAGVAILASAAGVLIAVGVQAVAVAVVWVVVALLARAYRTVAEREDAVGDPDAIGQRAWLLALGAGAAGSAIHVFVKALAGPTAIGVAGALATVALGVVRLRARTSAGAGAALAATAVAVVVFLGGGLAQTAHLLVDSTTRSRVAAARMPRCARPLHGGESPLELVLERVAGVAAVRVTYGASDLLQEPLVVWIAPRTGTALSPALRAAVVRAMANVDCQEDYASGFGRELRPARLRTVDFRARARLSAWANRGQTERDLRDELARWLEDAGSGAMDRSRVARPRGPV
ncbi:MAG: hypothetical protein IT379_02165, partial [Deltaproteobacteria bacterium]|nr:hypothetical protein [Deltaproteobacteria bacterium]